MKSNNTLGEIVSLCKRRGIVLPSSDIYGSVGAGYDYGPIGVLLKRNLEAAWWKDFVQTREDIHGFDSAIMLHPKTWQAAGHLNTFMDTFFRCQSCNARFRVDEIFTEKILGQESETNDRDSELQKLLEERDYRCPCDKQAKGRQRGLSGPEDFNLLCETKLGPTGDSTPTYLRPETAQGVYTQFNNIATTVRQKLPFGIGQIGKAFRNEIRSSHFLYRSREFEQCELQWFCAPDTANKWLEYWVAECYRWLIQLGISESNVRCSSVIEDELAHYSASTTDIEYRFPFGWGEVWGISNRTDFDLRNHSDNSGKDLRYMDLQGDTEKFYPYVIEPSMGVGRLVLALLVDGYQTESLVDGNGKTTERSVLKLHPRLSPFKLAILPLSKKEPLASMASGIHRRLLKEASVDFDATASIGKRYRRQDEIGTPYTVTVDFDSVHDSSVTIRDRDSMEQVRIPMERLFSMMSRGFYAEDFQNLFQEVQS